jgi:hypothetical protein
VTSDAAAIARALAHDVGKYVARAARNLPPEGPIPKVLADMLVRDLYAPLPSGVTPRARFDRLAAELEDAGATDARLADVRDRFDALMPLQAGIANGSTADMRKAAAEALAIERALSSLARDLSSGSATS